ncbi:MULTISPECIES: molecular chaperone DnaJ [Haloarcula]|jgi:molecular chaperone DnaJ|uniref:Chaperone protein DnaJ n=4 Tax=Haloarcula marismortui TaxID=2238 RepID=DNAJ_HALMA|nr:MULTISPECIES: molecular chaperone DnaJ [Haloarcula]Q5UXH9.1 RecName: Full=Chaperone protein DnaJ [Haloarcula marismortui ATCC 43049]AAV48024.1 chaperone protein DnaJ [Haloarcula marismortui ATCC 43049]EMA12868.1 chaperone protein DnaJ [Haloarcula sinaiiensis ATCC 33800]EMA17542.1 chaperone protein DnaJ [Haloarcula californiae ATCC 33799]NHN63723.1 molecular chaperone DnaJ [Haloarcula sp. JP-Z28]NHX39253.1 molecular chaperone DnaJ [Haloarcula sp. R1-2]
MSQDFYEILGVSRDASEDEIQEAYREKAREYHPDVSDDPDAEEKFKQAKKAKEVLTDEEKRQMYDQMGHERFEQAEKRGGAGGGGGRGGMGGDPFGGGAGGFDMQDIFDQFFGGGGRGGRGGSRRRQGQDLQTRLEIDLEEAYNGATKQLNVTRPEACDDCDGAGHPPGADSETCPECNGQGQTTQVQQTPMGRVQQRTTCRRCDGEGTLYDETCSTCRGNGVVQNDASLEVEIPSGIADGQTLRMEREGAPGENGGPNGDLLIEVQVRDHPDFERDGDSLQHQQAISFPQAVFGDTITVPTLDGEVEVDVPSGTQSGEVFRLEGKGMPRLRRRGHGDLYVQVQVVTPDSLNAEQKEALEQFAEAGGEEVDVDEGFFEKLKNSL